jgi:hypothetical protein
VRAGGRAAEDAHAQAVAAHRKQRLTVHLDLAGRSLQGAFAGEEDLAAHHRQGQRVVDLDAGARGQVELPARQ